MEAGLLPGKETAWPDAPGSPERAATGAACDEFVAVGHTCRLRFEGWRGLGFRFGAVGVGTVVRRAGWRFRCDEQAEVTLFPLRLVNHGVTTVETPEGCFEVRFQGRLHGLRLLAEGQGQVVGTAGAFLGRRGAGSYWGLARLQFCVTYRVQWEAGAVAG